MLPASPASSSSAHPHGYCALCQSPIVDDETLTTCPDCKTSYHQDCWEYNQGCALYGCPQAPPPQKLNTLEMPMSYWGREQKNCPACGRAIQAAAIRCRHCGATFASAQPQDADAFQQRAAIQRNLPRVRRGMIWLLVLSLLPCTAPVAAIFGSAWYLRRRQEVQQLPPLHCALCKLALGVAISQSAMLLVAAVLHRSLGG